MASEYQTKKYSIRDNKVDPVWGDLLMYSGGPNTEQVRNSDGP